MPNQPKNIWEPMVLLNQSTPRNILNGQDDLGTPKRRIGVAALVEEQKVDNINF